MMTVVIENRGSVEAPVSIISVAPRNHLSLARRSSIPALAPGERTTIELPVQFAADGSECVSITITASSIPAPSAVHTLASAASPSDFGQLAMNGFGQ
jgi:hypothetical protein